MDEVNEALKQAVPVINRREEVDEFSRPFEDNLQNVVQHGNARLVSCDAADQPRPIEVRALHGPYCVASR
jgi:hypothetical protein